MSKMWPSSKKRHDSQIAEKRKGKGHRPKMDGCALCGGDLRRVAGLMTCQGCGNRPNIEARDFVRLGAHADILLSGGYRKKSGIEEE